MSKKLWFIQAAIVTVALSLTACSLATEPTTAPTAVVQSTTVPTANAAAVQPTTAPVTPAAVQATTAATQPDDSHHMPSQRK